MSALTTNDYIPRQNEKFYFWQANFVNRVVINQVAWGLPAAAVAALVARRAEYEPLYHKSQEKDDRTPGPMCSGTARSVSP